MKSVGLFHEHLGVLENGDCLVLPGYNGKSMYATFWWPLPGVWATVDASSGRRLGCLSFAITRIWGMSPAPDLSDMSGARLAIQTPQRAQPGKL